MSVELGTIIVFVFLSGIAVGTGWKSYRDQTQSKHDWWAGWLQGISTEMVGAILVGVMTTLIVGSAQQRQDQFRIAEEQQRQQEEQRTQLVAEAGSRINLMAIPAIETLRVKGWLDDGALRNADLDHANWKDGDLSQADLVNANLSEATLRDARLVEANLSGANLKQAIFDGADVSKADLESADLFSASFIGANLTGANLQNIEAWCADFRGADLSSADLRGAATRNQIPRTSISVVSTATAIVIYIQSFDPSDFLIPEPGAISTPPAPLSTVRRDNSTATRTPTLIPIFATRTAVAILQPASGCEHSSFDETTRLPDGAFWTSETNLARFTDSEREDFYDVLPSAG